MAVRQSQVRDETMRTATSPSFRPALAEYNPFDSQETMRRRWILVASVAGAAGVAAGFWVRHQPGTGSDLRSLILAATGGRRPVEGRLSGFAAAPFEPAAAVLHQRPALAEAFHAAAGSLGRARSAAALADTALLKIVDRRWSEAARLLGEAIAKAPRETTALNDLAVVYLTQATEEGQPWRLVDALAAVERALSLSASSLDAAFNRALILERLGLREHARLAWRRYLAADAGSAWAAEAKLHLAALDESATSGWKERRLALDRALQEGQSRRAAAIVRGSAQSARVELETVVLGNWARAVQRGDEAAAARFLSTAKAMASGLQEVSDDRLAPAAVAAVEGASGSVRRLLAQGHLDFSRAYALYKQDEFEPARELFARAGASFRAAASPFSAWTDFYLASCDYRAERIGAAVAAAAELSRNAAANSFLNVAGRAEWMLGLIALEQASPQQALDPLRQALEHFQRAHESGNEGAVASLIASCQGYAGDTSGAWRFRYRAIGATLASDDLERLPAIYGAMARDLLKQHEVSAALAFQDEALSLVEASREPLSLAEAFWWRAMILHAGGQEARAADDVARARTWGEKIAHRPSRLRTLAGISVTEGVVQRSSQPRRSVASLSNALTRYRELSYAYLLVDIYWERALSFLALGEFDAAEADLAAGIEEFQRQRSRIHDVALQSSYFERAEQIVEAMIRFQLDQRQEPDRAFDVAEGSKARTLLDLAAGATDSGTAAAIPGLGGTAPPATAALVRRRLPPGIVLVQYGVLADRIAIWLYWSQGRAFQEVRLERHALEELVERFTAAARGAASAEELAQTSTRLFGLLITPVLAHLPERATLAIVPDKTLAAVPFAALRETREGGFLIERNALTVAPSASMLLHALDRARQQQPRRGRLAVLAVGNPAIDRSVHSQLAPLPFAEAEARQVAARNRESLALTGQDATVARFVALLNRYDLVHFSGHATRADGSPLAASLVLAPGAGASSGDLTAGEIQGLRLTRPRLIVLSACGSAAGPQRALEGVSHLANAFLAAGAPAVLADLWSLDDQRAAAFFSLFYRELEAAADPAGALQAAQIQMIRNPEPELRTPAAWAGFQLLGAVGSKDSNP